MIALLISAQLASLVHSAKGRKELICWKLEKLLYACQPGKPHGPLNLSQMWWRTPYIT
tara:strand:- start:233 stop:406 length:174 start_codon:yes stop_codon:yes gene_type:complete